MQANYIMKPSESKRQKRLMEKKKALKTKVQRRKTFSFRKIGKPLLVFTGLIVAGTIAYYSVIKPFFTSKKSKYVQPTTIVASKKDHLVTKFPKTPVDSLVYYKDSLKSKRIVSDSEYYKIVELMHEISSKVDSSVHSEEFFTAKIANEYSRLYREIGGSENFRKFCYSSLTKYFGGKNSANFVKTVFERKSEDPLIVFINEKTGEVNYKLMDNPKKVFFQSLLLELDSASIERRKEIADTIFKSSEYDICIKIVSSQIEAVQSHINHLNSLSPEIQKELNHFYKVKGLEEIQRLQRLFLSENFKNKIINWDKLKKIEKMYLDFILFSNISFVDKQELHKEVLNGLKKGLIPLPGHFHINKPLYNESYFLPPPYKEVVAPIYEGNIPAFHETLGGDANNSKIYPGLALGITSELNQKTNNFRAIFNFAVLVNGFGMEGKLAYQ